MENKIHQRRQSFSVPQSPKHQKSSGSISYKAWNWLQQAAFHDDHNIDEEHAASVAAAAFAIHSLQEEEFRNLPKMRESTKPSKTLTMRRKEDNISRRPSYAGETSMKRSFGQELRSTKESAFPVRGPSGISSSPIPRPTPPPVGYQKQKGNPQCKNVKTRPQTCEKAMIEMIQKLYEKIKSKLLSLEYVKKIQAKLQEERKKRAREMQNYQNMTVQRGRAHLEDKRRKEEFEARQKPKKVPKTNDASVKCLCFNC